MRDSGPTRQFLRHTVGALAYRAAKAIRGAPSNFADFRASETARTHAQILAHLSDLLDWALSMGKGEQKWHDSQSILWDKGVQRFFAALAAFDSYLASGEPLHAPAEKLFQGPIADGLTHEGQVALLRRVVGAPIRGENYFMADIAAGRVGPDQAAPRREFD